MICEYTQHDDTWLSSCGYQFGVIDGRPGSLCPRCGLERTERPTAVIDGFDCVYRGGFVCRVLDGNSGSFVTRDAILAAAELIRETDAWEREHGGTTND
jgi:hypothetical protein